MVLSLMDGFVLGDFYQAVASKTKGIVIIQTVDYMSKRPIAHN